MSMLQLFLAGAFVAAPLVLYFPPIRSLNLLVETAGPLLRDTVTSMHSLYTSFRPVVSRFFSSFLTAYA